MPEQNVGVSWFKGLPPTDLSVTQVYGFCFDNKWELLLLDDLGVFGLPGGKPEAGESYDATLKREALEEAQVELQDVVIIGYRLVQGDGLLDGAPYAQLRAIAKVKEILPPSVDPATGRAYRRCWVSPSEAIKLLNWGEEGALQVDTAWRTLVSIWKARGRPAFGASLHTTQEESNGRRRRE